MHIQINTDSNIEGREDLANYVKGVVEDASALTTVAVDGDPGVIVHCVPTGGWAFSLQGGALQAAPAPPALCQATLGRSAAAGNVVVAALDGANVRVESWNVPTGALSSVVALPLPSPTAVAPLHVEEPTPGQFVVVTRDDASLYRFGSDAVNANSALPSLNPVRGSRRRADSTLELFASDGSVLRWTPEVVGAVVSVVNPPTLSGSLTDATWRPSGGPGALVAWASQTNPDDDAYRVPTRCVAALPNDPEFEPIASACTPCLSRSQCRLFGESYLLGALAPETGVYAFGSLAGRIAFYTAPLARLEEP